MTIKHQKDIELRNMQLECIKIMAKSLITLCERSMSKGSDQLSRKAIKENADYLAEFAALFEKEVPDDPQKRISMIRKIEHVSEGIEKSATYQLLRDILGIMK